MNEKERVHFKIIYLLSSKHDISQSFENELNKEKEKICHTLICRD